MPLKTSFSCLDETYIKISYIDDPHGTPEHGTRMCSYEWIGPEDKPVRIERRFIREFQSQGIIPKDSPIPPAIITGLPWPLRLVEYEMYTASCLYMRTDQSYWPWLKHRTRYLLQQAERTLRFRIVWTLKIWGLANFDACEIPQWSDIGRKHV